MVKKNIDNWKIVTGSQFLLGLLFSVAVLCALPLPAAAQKIMEAYKKSMPDVALLEPKQFDASSFLHKDIPLGQASLEHSIRIPKAWSKDPEIGQPPITLNNKIFTEIARFYSPFKDDTRSFLKIDLMEMEFNFSAEQFFLKYLLSFNYTMQGFRVIDRNSAESLYVVLDGDREYIVRSVMTINGRHVFLVQYYMPTEFWTDEKSQQASVMSSFKVPNKAEEFVEPMLPYRFLDVAEVQYPKSWELRSRTFRSLDRMDIDVLNISTKKEGETTARSVRLLDGKVKLSLVSYFSTESLDQEIEKIKTEFSDSGMLLGDKLDAPQDIGFNEQYEFTEVEIFQATDKNNINAKYEFWLAAMGFGEYYYFATLLTPSRDEDYFLWARNTESFKAMLASFKPMVKG